MYLKKYLAKYTNLKGDIFGGLTAAVVALPLALAFGVQSGLGAQYGLYSSIILGFFACLWGGAKTQISGPTGPMTVVSALTIATFIHQFGGLNQAMPYIIATFALAGLIQVAFGFLKFGDMVRYVPYPVISGFMSGIGIIIVLTQLHAAFGYSSPEGVQDIIVGLPQIMANPNLAALCLTILTVLIIYLFPFVSAVIPSALVALLVLTIFNLFYHYNVPTIGMIPSSLPDFRGEQLLLLDWRKLELIIAPALTLGALGAIDALLSAVIADNLTNTKHDSNQELKGLGIGNFLSSLFLGIPGAGATMRTVVNINAGGRTRLSGIIHSVLLLLILLYLAPYAASIPQSVLSGILITVGISIIDIKALKHLWHVPRSEAFILVVVLLLTVFVNLLHAVAIGMAFAVVFFMKKMSDLAADKASVSSLMEYEKTLHWSDEINLPEEFSKNIYIKHIEGPLFFGFINQFKEMTKQIPDVEYVIIRMEKVPYIDQSGLYALEDSIHYLHTRGIEVMLSNIQSQPYDLLLGLKIIPNLISIQNIFNSFKQCINYLKNKNG